jgi:S-formylglutathione hydrolase FrmB
VKPFIRTATCTLWAASVLNAAETRFEISFTALAHKGPITGRILVAVARDPADPIRKIGDWYSQTPFFGVDVDKLAPGSPAIIDGQTLGYPVSALKEIAPGDYYVQAVLNIYTQFVRSDGHTIWAHMDQWEGQKFNRSPGNLYSDVRRVHLDPGVGYDIKLGLTKVSPRIELPADTAWVKHIRIQSQLLTRFWGRPIEIGATVLVPKDYDLHPKEHYPVIYYQGHFNRANPLGFADADTEIVGAGYDSTLSLAWMSDDFPRLFAVTFQQPTPYFDDSYAVNSANSGPYGDAILQELVPYLETHFRMISKPYARVLTGVSTGGWESLALQLLHADFFGGTWSFAPDPVDFQRYQTIDIYKSENAFVLPDYAYMVPERPMMRQVTGEVIKTVRQMSQLEEVLGSHGRSAQQYEAWEAAYGPVGQDGYPQPLWDKHTGKIDHSVANYMRANGYDLVAYLKANWVKLGPQLKGKLHVYVGDMDNFYLNLAVYKLEEYLKTVGSDATFEYGRPNKGHDWQPKTTPDLVRIMAAHIQKNTRAQ